MNNIDNLLQEIKEEMLNEPCVREYFSLKRNLDSNRELKQLDKQMKAHQKAMCQNQNNDEIYLSEKALYEECKNKIESNPVWINFQTVKEEVYSLLVDIKNILG